METEDKITEDVNSMEFMVKRSLLAKNKLAIILQNGDETQYCCVQCPVRSTLIEELEKHLLTHNKEYKHLCGICGTGLKRKEHLDRHTLEHQQVRPHICPICNKAFKRKEHLNVHLSIHSGDKTEVCILCQKSFYRKDHLQKHLQTHGKILMEQSIQILGEKELLALKSEVIDDEYNSSPNSEDGDVSEDTSLVIDTSKLLNEARPYACTLCTKTYKRKDHLKLHLQTHLKKNGRACSECGKVFQREEQLLSHMSVHLNQQYSQLYDDKAELHALLDAEDTNNYLPDNSLLVPRLSVPVSLTGPRSSVPVSLAGPLTDVERRHECYVCHKRFKRKQHLKVHYNIHTKVEPLLRCIKCNKGFNSDSDLENHHCTVIIPIQNLSVGTAADSTATTNAKKENQFPIEEVILPMEASHEDETQYVIRDESSIPVPQRVFVCKWCSKPFKRKDHYKIHLHIHTGVKSFFCTDCGKGFYRKDHLQKHMQVHASKGRVRRPLPGLLSLDMLLHKDLKPEITITAPSSSKLRVPLQIKVPYQVVMATPDGEEHSVTYEPTPDHDT